ncbi:MAG: efflux RND transporter periplasmic adaptor subunit [Rhizobiaceae bacterium]
MEKSVFHAMIDVLKPAWIAAISGLILALSACSEDKEAAKAGVGDQQPPGVSVITVTEKPFTESNEFIGQTEAFQQVDIRARISGFLDKKSFKDGSVIEKGDELFVIDPSEFNVALDSANAGLERAEAALLKWSQQLERTKTLVDKGTLSQANLDDVIAEESSARASVSAANADINSAKLNLGYTKIHSPIAGRIGKSQFDVGNLIGADSGVLATVVAQDPMRVVFSVSEKTFLTVQAAQSEKSDSAGIVPTIRFANGVVYPHQGEVLFVDNQVDRTTGTIRIYMKFPNPERTLLPGLFVSVIISGEVPEDRILVPLSAVQLNQSGSFVLVVDGESKVVTRAIQTGDRTGAELVVESGLEPGETIIVEGIQKVRPGMVVTPTHAVQSEEK